MRPHNSPAGQQPAKALQESGSCVCVRANLSRRLTSLTVNSNQRDITRRDCARANTMRAADRCERPLIWLRDLDRA